MLPWPRSKAGGFALDLSAAWAERSQQTRSLRSSAQAWSGEDLSEPRSEPPSNWRAGGEQRVGGCGRGLDGSSLSEPAAGSSPGNPRTAPAAERSGYSSLRSGGIPVLAPISEQSWKVTQTLLTLFTKEERGLKKRPPTRTVTQPPWVSLRVFVLGDGVCQFRD